ncbi:hypothetical protein V6N13_068345 [Hibiscus sabdariffa]
MVKPTTQVENPESTETTPKGWKEHRAEMENRMTNLEIRLDETNSKLERNNTLLANLLKMMAEKEGEQSPTPVKQNASQVNIEGSANNEKKK